jgi:hypothetical protein
MTILSSNVRRLACAGFTLLCSSAPLGCTVQTGDGGAGEPTEEVRAPLTGNAFYTWGTRDGNDYNTGLSDASWTCFLSGVAGDLSKGDSYAYDGRASVARVYTDGKWHVEAHGGREHDSSIDSQTLQPDNNPVMAHATCIPSVANRTAEKTAPFGLANTVSLGAVTSRRVCGLTAVRGDNAAWESDSDKALVWNDGATIYLTVNVSSQYPTAQSVSARCVDRPSGSTVTRGAWGVPDPGSATVNVGYDNVYMGCWLHGIEGHFTSNDWYDGALINWANPAPGWWTMALKNGKSGWVVCVD